MESFLIIYRYHVCRWINQFEWLSKIMGSSGLMERCETLIAVLSLSMCSLRNPIIFLWQGESDSGFVNLGVEDTGRWWCPEGRQLTCWCVADCGVLPFIAMNQPPSQRSIKVYSPSGSGRPWKWIRINPIKSLWEVKGQDVSSRFGDKFDFHRWKSRMLQMFTPSIWRCLVNFQSKIALQVLLVPIQKEKGIRKESEHRQKL